MTDHPSSMATGLTSLTAVAGVAGVYALSEINIFLAGAVGTVFAAGLLIFTVERASGSSAKSKGTARATAAPRPVSTPPRASTPRSTVRPTPTAPAAPVTPTQPTARIATPESTWAEATARHDDILSEYATWELDPRMLLSYPALWNYSLPENREFFTALERASQLRTTDIPGGTHSPDAIAVDTFDAVTRRLREAWTIAEQNARRTGLDDLSDSLHKDADRALKLLTHADGASTDAEAASYLTQASALMRRLTDRGVIPAHTRASAELERRRTRAIEGPERDMGTATTA